MWLNEQQVADLTRRKRPSAQMRVLAESGIPFRQVDGRPIVEAANVVISAPQPKVRHLPRANR